MLNIPDYNTLLGHPVVCGSWEGFIIENIMAVVPPRVQPYYYGTPQGAEIDLVLEFPGGIKWAIEIKRSSAPSVDKGFYTGCEGIKADKRFVVYSGKDRFPMSNGVIAIPLPDLMQELLIIRNIPF